LELSSDYTPILITLHTLDERIDKQIPLKSKSDIETAVAILTAEIQQAARLATPPPRPQPLSDNSPLYIKQKLTDKRKARRRWQITWAPEDKQIYNKQAKELKHLHNHKNNSIQQYLENLTPHKDTNCSLWKVTRNLKQPQHHTPPLQQDNTWVRTDEQKATAFAHHLSTVFCPFPSQATTNEEDNILQELGSPHKMTLPLQKNLLKRSHKYHPITYKF